MKATAEAHPNIALVKYWGKRDEERNLPAAGSVSLTLGPVRTRTTVTWGRAAGHALRLDGVDAGGRPLARVGAALERIRALRAEAAPEAAAALGYAAVESDNDFPTAAGLASSASAFAALVLAASRAAGLELAADVLSEQARIGSGSAARSLFGGFVRMQAGTRPDGRDAVARPLHDADHWDLRVLVAITREGEKEVSSTEGMRRTTATSPYWEAWVRGVEPDCDAAQEAIAGRDFGRLAEIAEASALRMHASAIAAAPGVLYWRGATVETIHAVRALRDAGTAAFFTIDAGPHVKVFAPAAEEATVRATLEQVPGVLRVIALGPGGPARLVGGAQGR